MTSISDQFSAVRKAQFEAQFNFFNSMTSQALESVSRVAALNMAVSRDAVQRSLGASFALMNSRDPRDVLSLGGQAEEGFRSLFAYGRELLGIAGGVRPYTVLPQLQFQASQQAVETVEAIERSAADTVAEAATDAAPAIIAAPAAEAPHAVSAIAPVTQPVVVAEPAPQPEPEPEALAVAAEPVPVAEPKAIVKAVGKGVARAAAADHPAAAPVAPAGDSVEVPKVETPAVAPRRKK